RRGSCEFNSCGGPSITASQCDCCIGTHISLQPHSLGRNWAASLDFMMDLFTFILIASSFPSLILSLTWKNRLEVTPGLIVEQLPLPVIYETFLPAILEYKRPIVNSSDLSTDAIFHRNCTSNEYFPNSPCPTAYYLKEEVDRFYQFFKESHSTSEFSQTRYGQQFNWNDMEETFNIFMSSFAINDAVTQHIDQLIEDAPMKLYHLEKDIKEFNSVNITNIRNMMQAFYDQYWKEISSDRIDDALYANAISLYETMLLQQHIMEIVRWNRVMEDCGNYKIPRSFVREAKIKGIMDRLRQNLTKNYYDFAIPDENQYYQHKLASCVVTPTSVFVTIRIPISRAVNSSNIEFFKAHAVPFLTPHVANISESICRVNVNDEHYIYNNRLGYVKPSNCQPFQLCQIPKYWYNDISDPCLTAVRELNGVEIVKQCPITCMAEGALQLQRYPLIKQVSRNNYAVTGKTDGTLIKCPDRKDAKVPEHQIGAIILELQPYCRIQVDQGQPTTDLMTLSGNTIIPVHWTLDKKLGPVSTVELSWGFLQRTNAQAINPNVSRNVQIPTNFFSSNVPDETSKDSLGLGLELLWLLLLTIGLVAGFVYVFFTTRKIDKDVIQNGRKESVVYLTSPSASDMEY
ncbi:unnamed protein product, partial [Allacma fusca]